MRADQHRRSDARTPREAPRASRRRLVAALVAVAVLAGIGPGLATAQSETDAERSARLIQEARDRANAAADAYFRAESQLDVLEEELISLELREDMLQSEVDALRKEVANVAIARYVSSGAAGIPLLTDVSEPQDQVQAEVYTDVLTNTGGDVIDEFDAAERELQLIQDDVRDQQIAIEAQREEHARLRDAANDEVTRLRAIEEERLQDEAVQAALAAQLAKERARLEEQARLDAAAAARAQPNPGIEIPVTTVPPATTTTVEGTVDDESAAAATADEADAADDAPIETTTTTTLPPASTLPANAGASGGESGGRTGVEGAGSSPGIVTLGPGGLVNGVYVDNIVCPILGSAFGDTWGAPRSGGRRHVGVDMIAPRGVPIYAVVNGTVTFKANPLGGNAASLVGDNGNRYYYGHMDSYEGSSPRRVVAGEIIAYNGDTGNAKFSTPHLHFELRPGGGLNVNPYYSVRAAGC